jgi:hypothetical protein
MTNLNQAQQKLVSNLPLNKDHLSPTANDHLKLTLIINEPVFNDHNLVGLPYFYSNTNYQ